MVLFGLFFKELCYLVKYGKLNEIQVCDMKGSCGSCACNVVLNCSDSKHVCKVTESVTYLTEVL